MAMYKNILVAVDLHPEHDDKTTQHAMEVAKLCDARVFIVHAFEEIHTYGATQGYEIIMGVEESLIEEAKKLLSALSEKYNIPAQQQIFAKGSPKMVILEQAKKQQIDLIVVGSHTPHGLNMLLGTTVDGVTHHAPCDVLAVRVDE